MGDDHLNTKFYQRWILRLWEARRFELDLARSIRRRCFSEVGDVAEESVVEEVDEKPGLRSSTRIFSATCSK